MSSLPIVALMTFGQDGQTLAGVTAAEAGRRLRGLDLAAIGANHGAGPAAALTALSEMRADGTALAALPNVGLASLSGTRIVYPHATPDYFGEFAAQARALGAAVIGGCCGTTPAQIEAIAAAVAAGRRPSTPIVTDEGELAAIEVEAGGETELARLLREGEFVVSVQLDPPLGGSNRGLLEAARELKRRGVAIVDVNDNPRARASMSGIMASVAIERFAGIETIPHLTPRDSTIVGLESLLLGAHAEGVRNVLSVTGDPPESGDYPGLSGGVYQVDSIGLVEVIARLNRGEDFHGRDIDAPTSFFIGVAVNPTADDLDEELRRFERKVDAGARFAMTQVLYDLEYLDRFVERLGGAWPIPTLVGIWPLRSHALAVRIHNEVPGIVVPEPVQERLREAGADAPQVGLELARELLAESAGKGAGSLRGRAVPPAARRARPARLINRRRSPPTEESRLPFARGRGIRTPVLRDLDRRAAAALPERLVGEARDHVEVGMDWRMPGLDLAVPDQGVPVRLEAIVLNRLHLQQQVVRRRPFFGAEVERGHAMRTRNDDPATGKHVRRVTRVASRAVDAEIILHADLGRAEDARVTEGAVTRGHEVKSLACSRGRDGAQP